MKVQIKELVDGYAPKRATAGASGFDLKAAENVVIEPWSRAMVRTGICIALPPGMEAQVRPRSGLAAKHGVVAHFGTIDSDYRGEIHVILFNLSNKEFFVRYGDRIAQLVFSQIVLPEFEIVEFLPPTERGENGFGSTGV